MSRYINILLLAIFLLQGCSSIKGLFGKKSIGDPNDPDFLNKVQELKHIMVQSLYNQRDMLIEIVKLKSEIIAQKRPQLKKYMESY